MKVFRLNDCDWYASEDMESAINQIMHDTGNAREDCIDDNAHELTDEEMSKFCVRDEDDRLNTLKIPKTFKEELDLLISEGYKFPIAFASTEY